MLFYCSLRNITRSSPYSNGSAQAYLYRFDHVPTFATGSSLGFTCKKGACHGDELRFVFDDYENVTVDRTELELGSQMQQYWMNFIRTGNPNESKNPPAVHWPIYNAQNDTIIIFGGNTCGHKGCAIRTETPAKNQLCDEVWDRIGYLRRHEKWLELSAKRRKIHREGVEYQS